MADPTVRTSRWPTVIVAALGLALSIWLEVVHYRAYTAPLSSSFCSVGARLDCASVALSRFSMFLGVPVPIWGVAGFLALTIAAWQRSRWLLPLSAIAALVSVVLLGVSVFSIKSLCLLCEGVHVLSVVLFVLAWKERRSEQVALGDRDTLLTVFGPALGLVIGVMLFQQPYWGAFGWKGDVPFPQGKTAEGHPWIGAENPKLVLNEFTDYSCPHCKIASTQTLKSLAAHPKELRIVRRQYPRMACPKGENSACHLVRLAYCAEEQGKFWEADRWLFEHAGGRHEVDPGAAARDIGLDEAKLRACMVRDDIFQRADDESRAARKKRIAGTPYYIVGDKAVPPEEVAKLLREL
jgi:uncharacterized membrane protein